MVKRFRTPNLGGQQREWRALNLLAEFAPGLAPAPLAAYLDASPPVIQMTRVPGEPLAGQSILPYHLNAITDAVGRLHTCVPPGTLDRVPPHPWLAKGMANQMRSLASQPLAPHDDPTIRVAFAAAQNWLGQAADPTEPLTPVFGQGDSSLANFLWDGTRVRLVDFEDSGRNDRAFELAALTEHIGFWDEAGLEAGTLLDRFEPTAAESARVLFYRRAFGIFWLLLLRNRPGSGVTLRRQAVHLLELLA
ncbi:MAG TPA: phosphotransferase, partial [Streptosporangiaceae bacterium]